MNVIEESVKIVSRQYKKKDLGFHKMTRENLRELEDVIKEIKTDPIPKKFVKRKLKGKIGYGLFLHVDAEPILRGQVVGPYGGIAGIGPQNGDEDDNGDYTFDLVNDLHLTKEEQERYDPKNRYHPRRLYSLKVDALETGTFTRFINHSDKPNIAAYLVETPDCPYSIVYFAKRRINPGEQLLVCYEGEDKSYWGALGIKPFPMTAKTFRLDKALELVFKE